MLNFVVLLAVSISTTFFILRKAQQAVDEINRLSIFEVYTGKDIERNKAGR